MDVKIIAENHPNGYVSSKDVSIAKKQAMKFAKVLQSVDKKDVFSVKVTWTPDGKVGGKKIVKMNQSCSDLYQNTLINVHLLMYVLKVCW